ncbi:hypothetical protein ACSBR2_009463 [Camellia fascicularis]
MSSSFDHSSSESEQSSSSSSSSDETQTTLKMKVIPDPPASWHPPGSLPTTSRSSSTSHGSVSAGPSLSQATQKQTRGPTYVHGQWGTSEDGILKVVPNELNQVVEGHTSLASHLGVLARDGSLAPLAFTTWHYVPKQNKDNIWREIKAHTDADESMKRTIMASFGKKWRDWKSRVKTTGYKPFKNDAERLAHRSDRVHEDQWRALVYYWGTQSASKSSKKNRKIRKKKTLHHRTGRKPFSVVRLEETKKNNGVPASRSQVWMAAYLKDGTSNSDSVNEVMTQMNELAEHMEGSSTDPAALQEQIFTQVMGPERPGRVRTFGLGPSPTDVFGGGYRRSQEQNRLFQTQVQEQVQEQLQRLWIHLVVIPLFGQCHINNNLMHFHPKRFTFQRKRRRRRTNKVKKLIAFSGVTPKSCGDLELCGFKFKFMMLQDVVHSEKRWYLVFEYLDLDLKKHMDSCPE